MPDKKAIEERLSWRVGVSSVRLGEIRNVVQLSWLDGVMYQLIQPKQKVGRWAVVD